MKDEPDNEPPQPPAETDERFPSGPWVGFWLQRPLAGRQWMREVYLRFADGKVSGFGSDWVGEFSFRGTYDLKTGRVALRKDYVGSHTVRYDGQNENDGQWLWGIWTLRDVLGSDRGGFHLWPKGVNDPTQPKLEAEADAPVEEKVLVSADA